MSNNPQKMIEKLRQVTKAHSQPKPPQIQTTEELALQSHKQGHWNESLLQVTKNEVRAGKSDEEIHRITDALTQDGYTVAETRKDVQPMIDGARSKPLGKFHPNTANVFRVLTTDDHWKHVFAFDEFNNQQMIISKPPYQTGNPLHFKPKQITDDDYVRVQIWLQSYWSNPKKASVIDAVNVACQEQIISPVKHYLEGLPPSTIDISEIFENYFGVIPDNDEHRDFIRAASTLFFKQAVARAVDAGCKADTVVVFEGKQGIGKSSGLRALFGADWFKDSMPPMGSKDASDYIVGAWCIELAEMAFQRKAEIEQQKAFISRQEEKYRPAYKKKEIVYKRRCVFAATTNRDDWAVDDTGNRRFLPVKTTEIDVAGIKRDRDAIWGSAYAAYLREPKWWLDDEHAIYSDKQTELRQESDIWVEIINKAMANIHETTVTEAFSKCFSEQSIDDRPFDPQAITRQDQRRMSNCLQAAGWERAGKYSSGSKRNQVRFVRPTIASEY
tara:strand:- start:234 stop:1733 length:1500 start_codon:yes stop_codon:yes gene_type:complete